MKLAALCRPCTGNAPGLYVHFHSLDGDNVKTSV